MDIPKNVKNVANHEKQILEMLNFDKGTVASYRKWELKRKIMVDKRKLQGYKENTRIDDDHTLREK